MFIIGLSLALTAQVGCKSTKMGQTSKKEASTDRTVAQNPSPQEAADVQGNEVEAASETNMVQSYNGSTGSNVNVNSESLEVPITGKEDYSKMYAQLKMTDDQIRQYENAIEEFERIQRKTPNGQMMGTVAGERQKQLKEILTSDQYRLYEQWKKD